MQRFSLIMFLLTVVVLCSFTALAGDIEVNVDQELEGIEELEIELEDLGGFKGNGFFQVSRLHLDLQNLNQKLAAVNYNGSGFKQLPEEIYLFGGGGLGGFKNGLRFGGYGLEGKTSSPRTSDGKKAELSIAYGGFLLEKGVYAAKSTDIAIGTMLGGGSMKLDLSYADSLSLNEPVKRIYQKDFFVLEPGINLHQQLAPFLGLDLGVTYLFTFDDADWGELDGTVDNLQGPSFNVKLSMGF